jgi:hypothetical protein
MASLHARRQPSPSRSPGKTSVLPGLFPTHGVSPGGAIDSELAFEAAVAIALGAGTLSRAGEADRDRSRFTDASYVLMGVKGGAVQRIPRAEIVAELERRARINSNLEQYHLRFRPGRATVLVALFAGFTAVLGAQGWMNMLNERRIAALEESYLEHQASVVQGEPTTEMAAIETVGEFESRVMRARLDGCYDEVKASLARAADQLKLATRQRGQEGANPNLLKASHAYEDYKLARDNCRNSMFDLMSWLPSGK